MNRTKPTLPKNNFFIFQLLLFLLICFFQQTVAQINMQNTMHTVPKSIGAFDDDNDDDDNDDNDDDTTMIHLKIKMFLEGAMLDSTNGFMRTNLTSGIRYLPLIDPYFSSTNPRFNAVGQVTAQETSEAIISMFANSQNAIVDWVFIEFRDVNDPSQVLTTKSALLQSDGDVIDPVTGNDYLDVSTLLNNTYLIAVKHRNHLGVMWNTPYNFSNSGVYIIDFSVATGADIFDLTTTSLNYNDIEQVTIGNIKALRAGNANGDTKVILSDINKIQVDVITHPDNVSFDSGFNFAFGYFDGDINMDGKVSFSAAIPDTNKLQLLILLYPLNTNFDITYAFNIEQLP